MLCARLDGETILIHERKWETQAEFLRKASRAGRLLAPCCEAPLVLRWGVRKVRHFAHPPRVECPYDRWSEVESPEHVAGKIRLYDWCQEHFGARLRLLALEHPLPETLQRPDVYFELDDGSRYALEYQRSVITPGEWAERHAAYAQQGVHDIWVLGENRLADALPTPDQQARWGAREPHMHFLRLRAFETAAATRTPYEVAWWRGEQQEELWLPQELDARVGREVSPWYNRAALARLRSISFLDAGTGELTIYRAMRELPRHTDTQMAAVVLRTALDEADLTPAGFVTNDDLERLTRHEARVARLEAARQSAPPPPASGAVAEEAAPYDAGLFSPAAQAAEQQRRLQGRAAQPDWRKIVDRFGLTPENLHFLIGIPIPDDTVILVHRTVWQAYLYYGVVRDLSRSLSAPELAGALERRFGFDPEMVRVGRYLAPGRVSTPADVVGRFLNLLVDTGSLRNDMNSELFRYHPPTAPAPPLAFADRNQRHAAWEGLLLGRLRLEGMALVGDGGPVPLVPAHMEDRPTPAQVQAVRRISERCGLEVDLSHLTFTEAGRLLSKWRR